MKEISHFSSDSVSSGDSSHYHSAGRRSKQSILRRRDNPLYVAQSRLGDGRSDRHRRCDFFIVLWLSVLSLLLIVTLALTLVLLSRPDVLLSKPEAPRHAKLTGTKLPSASGDSANTAPSTTYGEPPKGDLPALHTTPWHTYPTSRSPTSRPTGSDPSKDEHVNELARQLQLVRANASAALMRAQQNEQSLERDVRRLNGRIDALNGPNGTSSRVAFGTCAIRRLTSGNSALNPITRTNWYPPRNDSVSAKRLLITGIECSSNGMTAMMKTQEDSRNVQQFRCECTGAVSSSTNSRYCYMYVWECSS